MVVPHLEKVREKVKATGLWIPQIPTEYGGLGLSVAAFGEVSTLLLQLSSSRLRVILKS